MADFETLLGLVSHYSPSGGERAAAEWLTARMQTLGYDRSFIDEAGNAVGILGQGSRQAVLLGHIDTVPGEIPVRRDQAGGASPVLYGRGAVDAKGPLACFVDAAAQVGRTDDWQFVVIGAVEEERDSQGARFAAQRYRPAFAIIGEPNHWDRLGLGYKGSAAARIRVTCREAHPASGEPTAAEAAVEVWLAIESHARAYNAGKPRVFDHILPSLRELRSGRDEFEQWASLDVGMRLPTGLSPEAWYGRLRELAGATRAGSVVVEPTGFSVPAWTCEKNTPLVRAFLAGIRAQGGEPRFVYKTGTADLNIVAPAWGCPAVVYGPGDSSLDHTPDEHLALDDYARAVSVLRQVLSRLARTD